MIYSMTAFARHKGQDPLGTATWEIRGVNHRYLEVSVRLPESLRYLEGKIREKLRQSLHRGKIECTLRYESSYADDAPLQMNEALLKQLSGACQQIEHVFSHTAPVNALELLRWPGVLQADDAPSSQLESMLLAALAQTITALQQARAGEGQNLGQFLEQRLVGIEQQIKQISEYLPMLAKQQRERLLGRCAELSITVDNDRLEQELLLLAQKSDVSEEIDRLGAHVQQVRQVLAQGGSIGRRLDFLMQELNREANTLGSKSTDNITTTVSVELKVLIEQMREQVQNIE